MTPAVRRSSVVAMLSTVVAFVACDLNPQPLPPLDPENRATGSSGSSSGGFGAIDDSGDKNTGGEIVDAAAPPPMDAGSFPDGAGNSPDATSDATTDANDAGDAGP